MKYVLMCVIAMVVCFGIGITVAILVKKLKKIKTGATVGLAFGVGIVLLCGVGLGYLNVYYPADETAVVYVPTVEMKKIDGAYYFDGPGEDRAIIFYPGAKVETIAYAPLMSAIAEEGIDCFLVDMPFRMAMLDSNAADRIISSYAYDNWTMAGHSLGGLVASGYATKHSDFIDGIVLLASFPNSKIPDEIRFCSIYGTNDGCLSTESYEDSKEYWPSDVTELVIEGGNHAQYANYGSQSDDNEASITREEQQRKTVECIVEFCH